MLTPCRQSSEGAPHDLAGTAEAEHRLGIRLPSDYIAFIETYGAGGIDGDALWVSPHTVKPEATAWSTWPNSSGNRPRILLALAATRGKRRQAPQMGLR
ncbi:SMI1/KNR4 family protein [Streptomyces goshikiensis]